MKLSALTHAILAFPLASNALAMPTADVTNTPELEARQNCELRIQWTNNWVEAGLSRYQVQLITSPRNDAHLGIYCRHWSFFAMIGINRQCYWSNGAYYIDASYARGPEGHGTYKDNHFNAAGAYRRETGCRTVLNT